MSIRGHDSEEFVQLLGEAAVMNVMDLGMSEVTLIGFRACLTSVWGKSRIFTCFKLTSSYFIWLVRAQSLTLGAIHRITFQKLCRD